MNARDRGVSTETPAGPDAEGPLRRWARRKREVAREKEAADEAWRRGSSRAPSGVVEDVRKPADDASAPAVVEGQVPADAELAVVEGRVPADAEPAVVEGRIPADAEPAVVEGQVPTDADMPPLDSLDENSDYRGFLSPGVSEGLRRRALRKLFMSAAFNVRDGLDDYDEDFTSFEVLGDIVTSDMRHQAEAESERVRRARTDSGPADLPEDDARRADAGPDAGGAEEETDAAPCGADAAAGTAGRQPPEALGAPESTAGEEDGAVAAAGTAAPPTPAESGPSRAGAGEGASDGPPSTAGAADHRQA